MRLLHMNTKAPQREYRGRWFTWRFHQLEKDKLIGDNRKPLPKGVGIDTIGGVGSFDPW